MAFIKTNSNRMIPVPADKALAIWQVFNGEVEGTREQQVFCKSVDRIYLNWHTAPSSYRLKYAVNGESRSAHKEWILK